MINEENTAKGRVLIENKKIFTLDGVNNVLGFDEGMVLLDTSLGDLTVEGSELKIESLSKDGGEIVITGNISGVFYSEKKESKGIFRGFFK